MASETGAGADGATGPYPIVVRLRADLTRAMKERDRTAVSVLRTTLAAIANAEAPPAADTRTDAVPEAPVVGQLTEHTRLVLSDADLEHILRHEIADRVDTIDQFARGGRDAEASALQAEISILERYLV